ncbi:MAG: NAD(P)H-dependent oxidoreductase [Carboxylicivirga sp.]|nr:NAD(P)H-dependent oxidoreductase [Carboxylicivirga sp.]
MSMKKRILAFGASSSKNSINKQLAAYTSSLMKDVQINLIDLNDYEMPLFSVDIEKESGIPEKAFLFKEQIKSSDGIILSLAEHNGAYSSAYKNIFDWTSRIEKEFWYNRPMLLLATSPGPNGAKRVLKIANEAYSYSNKNIAGSFSLPSFYENFSNEKGIVNDTFKNDLLLQLAQFEKLLFTK